MCRKTYGVKRSQYNEATDKSERRHGDYIMAFYYAHFVHFFAREVSVHTLNEIILYKNV